MRRTPDMASVDPIARRGDETWVRAGHADWDESVGTILAPRVPGCTPGIAVRVDGPVGAVIAGIAFDGRRCFLFARIAYDSADEEMMCAVVDLGESPASAAGVSPELMPITVRTA